MHTDPRVSIIIPTRNRSMLLSFAIESALQQTYKNLQIVVHDNNSADGTPDIVKPYLQDSRLEYHRVDHDLTMTENWNSAFQKVRGDYVVRLDDDNILLRDYVESALQEINRLQLDIMIFSPLLIQARRKVCALIDPGEETTIINPYQWLFLEYFAYTDSNYALYRTELLRTLFPDGSVYMTSLPDRFMNYRCIDAMKRMRIRVGISPKLKGITRFDNTRPKLTQLHYVNYARINAETVANTVDCHHNYPMHRILTIRRILDSTENQDLRLFFDRTITAESLQTTLMRTGHIYSMFRAQSLREFGIYITYVAQILFALLRHPFSHMEAQAIPSQLLRLLQKTGWYVLRTLGGTRTMHAYQPDVQYGNTMVRRALNQGLEKEHYPSLYGTLEGILRRIQAPKE